jgi:hypothetical protein
LSGTHRFEAERVAEEALRAQEAEAARVAEETRPAQEANVERAKKVEQSPE